VRAIVVKEYGPIHSHVVEQVSDPSPEPGQVLVDIHAIGLNFPDVLMLEGKYQNRPSELPFVPGRDASGLVIDVGDGVTGFKPGDKVLVQVFSGAFAEKVAAPQERCCPMPDSMNFVDAAAMITTYRTAYIGVVVRGQIQPGETALVTGAAGGVGVAAVQLLKAKGANVIAAVSTPEKARFAVDNGADHAIYTNSDDLKAAFRGQVEKVTGAAQGRGCDLAYDTVGGDVFDACLRVLKFAGRLVIAGFANGQIPAAKANYLLYNNLTVMGGPLDINFKMAYPVMQQAMAEINDLYTQGKLKPTVMRTYPLEDFKTAFDVITGRQVLGKVVLTIDR